MVAIVPKARKALFFLPGGRTCWSRIQAAFGAVLLLALAGCEDGLLTGLFSDGGESKEDFGGVYATAIPKIVKAESLSFKEKFGIASTGTSSVTEAFTTLHTFIQAGGLNLDPPVIRPGDYIDLASLRVEAYNGEGRVTAVNTPINKQPYEGYEGRLLRLVVVGVNSFHSRDEYRAPPENDAVPHVVFQFQNIPVSLRMKSPYNSSNEGYEGSDMRRYLVPVEGAEGSGAFLRGLTEAGVPEEILWAPTRFITENGNHDFEGYPDRIQYYYENFGILYALAEKAQTIRDKLWLPTHYEMNGGARVNGSYAHAWFRGSPNSRYETPENQAKLDYYYEGTDKMIKYDRDSGASFYWLGSPSEYDFFCYFDIYEWRESGNYFPEGIAFGASLGVAPAFCVK
jgi:hypothetical protein